MAEGHTVSVIVSYLALKPVARVQSGPKVPEAASSRGRPGEGGRLRGLGAVPPLTGAVAGGGAGAREGGLGAAR